MNNKDIAKKLIELIHLDTDAVEAYEQALKNIDVPEVHQKISQFRDDHKRHITDLSRAILSLGETPPEPKKDLKGFFIKGFTAIRSATGTEGALKAMQTNEKLTNRVYFEALDSDLSPQVRAIVEKNYEDEKRHLHYIEEMLEMKPWEVSLMK